MNAEVLAETGVLHAVRTATRSRHADLAASPPMVRLFDAAYTLAEYRAHLCRLLGLFEPLERLATQANSGAADPIHGLNRASALRDDLDTMGATAEDLAAIERCAWLPPIEPAGMRGYAYVMLGSMLGGTIIVKRLRAVLGQAASFHFYGDGNGRSEALWARFCADLEEHGGSDIEAICSTAVSIFDAYATWLSEPALAHSVP